MCKALSVCKKKVQQQKWITWRFYVNNLRQDIKISLGYDGNFSWDLEPPKNHGFVPTWERKNKRSPNWQFFDANFWMTNSHGFFRYCIILPNMSVVKVECQTP